MDYSDLKINQKDNELETVPDISANIDNYDIASWELDPGDLIAFNFSISSYRQKVLELYISVKSD